MISVIIPVTYDRKDNLDNVLNFFRLQDCPHEIILVENCLEKRFPESYNTKFVKNKFSRGGSFNEGYRFSNFDYLLFHDADIVSNNKSFLSNCFEFLKSKNLEYIITYEKVCYLKSFEDNQKFLNKVKFEKECYTHSIGGSGLISKKFFEKLGGFNSKLIEWGYEDNELYEKAELFTKILRYPTTLYHLFHKPPVFTKQAKMNQDIYLKFHNLSKEEKLKYIEENKFL